MALKMVLTLKQERETLKRELISLGEDTPVNDFERSNLLMQMIAKVE